MKSFVLLFSFFLSMATVSSQFNDKRQLLIFAGDGKEALLQTQTSLFDSVKTECRERDLEVSIIPISKAALRSRYKIEADAFAIVLIGKDGGEKYRSSKVVQPSNVFAIIDAMPMRRAEMRRQNPHP